MNKKLLFIFFICIFEAGIALSKKSSKSRIRPFFKKNLDNLEPDNLLNLISSDTSTVNNFKLLLDKKVIVALDTAFQQLNIQTYETQIKTILDLLKKKLSSMPIDVQDPTWSTIRLIYIRWYGRFSGLLNSNESLIPSYISTFTLKSDSISGILDEQTTLESDINSALKSIITNPLSFGSYKELDSNLQIMKNQLSLDKFVSSYQKNVMLSVETLVFLASFRGLNTNPSKLNPIVPKNSDDRSLLTLINNLISLLTYIKAPNIDEFPYDYQDQPALSKYVVTITSTPNEFGGEEIISSGYYLPAGVVLSIRVLSGNPKNWKVKIGSHTDRLDHLQSIVRWPSIVIDRNLDYNTQLSSPFGGLIDFTTDSDIPKQTLQLELTNCVEAPFIDSNNEQSIKDWDRRKNSPGFWSVLKGNAFVGIFPYNDIRSVDKSVILNFLNITDTVVLGSHKFRGSQFHRSEQLVLDIQIEVGALHAGYPIMADYEIKMLGSDDLYGLFHEIGHNMQRDQWTFDNTSEVTNDIFAYYAYKLVYNIDFMRDKPKDDITTEEFDKFFKKVKTFDGEKSSMLFTMFDLLVKHFGWTSMSTFFNNYEKDIQNKVNLPVTNQDKIDQWVLRYSLIVNRNIKPLFEMYFLNVSSSVDSKLAGLRKWCPYEERNSEKFLSSTLYDDCTKSELA